MPALTDGFQSRRALLGGGLGALAALVVQAMTRPLPVAAADVVLGGTNTTNHVTTIVNTSGTGLKGQGTAVGVYGETEGEGGAIGVEGHALASTGGTMGVRGTSDSVTGVGVKGVAMGEGGVGVEGFGGRAAVQGITDFPHGSAVRGQARLANPGADANGVVGFAAGPLGVGVRGLGTNGTGVAGFAGLVGDTLPAPADTGVYGQSTRADGFGVMGRNADGTAIDGETIDGIAIKIAATGNGTALEAMGPVKFSSAGLDTIATGTNAKQVAPGVDLNSQSKVLVTLNGNPGAGISVQRVGINGTTNQFTVFLTANATADAKFSWFVIS
jgi:hypothetical protein